MNQSNSAISVASTPQSTPRSLWDDEPETSKPKAELPPLTQQAVRPLKQRELYPNSMPTDVHQWLELNKPHSFRELMDLRKTLYSRKCNFGKYHVTKRGHTSRGEEKFVLTGPVSAILILSNRCRHYLLRTLNRLRRAEGWPPIAYQ
ncbi:hypothetical protein [Afipia sp. GAS231]|uniref:hypothetical protein n=1 Tax=Afipia sp. GAS231 TaxID=1882747 RepID=UPI00087CFA97|nr:hypothetical protein [Afipia sp. GAS231]SDO20077.1 hypothetical protein SAMN05444050_3509 [Afipia sp. GAS231]